MSLIDDASLIMYPSGYKEDKLYSLKPTNGDGDFTFTRASSATRVNAEGLIETASVLGSELVLSTLINSNYDTFNEASVSGFHAIYSTSGTQRASTVDEINFVNGKTYQVNIDVSVVSGSVPFLRARTAVATNPTIFSGQLVDGSNVVTFTSTSTFTGLLEFASSNASEYRVSNVSVKEVITNNVPRLDYSGGASCASLLLEPQRSNLITYSESFDNAAYIKVGGSVVANNSTSPDGFINADTFTADGAYSSHRIFQTFSATSGSTYTASFFVKKETADFVQITVSSGTAFGTTNFANFDISTGVLGTSGGSQTNNTITNYGNGWYRISSTITAVGTATAQVDLCIIQAANSVRLQSWTSALSVVLYGASLEIGSYATSYIPTTSSTVTRTADACNGAGTSATFNDSEGVLMAEISSLANDSNERFLSVSDGTTANRISLWYYSATNGLAVAVYSGSVAQFFTTTILSNDIDYNKIAIKYKVNDFALWVNGIEVATDTSGIAPVGLSELAFDRGDGALDFYGKTKQLQYFDSALTDSELEQLTSWTSFSEMATAQNYTII